MFGRVPQPGDWVATRHRIPISLTDHLLGDAGGLKPGTRGVVVRSSGFGRVEARFSIGLAGSVTASVRSSDLRVVRRGGGEDAFAAHTSRLNAARLGVAIALIAPFAYFVVAWHLHGGTKEGLLPALIDGACSGALDLLAYALTNPMKALIYLVIVTLAGRFAFRA